MKVEEKKDNKINIRCTEFEYSPSETDSDEDNLTNKNNTNIKNSSNKIYKQRKKSKKIDTKIKEKTNKNKPKKYLSRYVRMILFFLLLLYSIAVDLDSGIIVSSYKSFTQDLNMNDLQFGSLNSITIIGKIISLLIILIIINKNHRKFIIVTTSFLQALYFYGFLLSDNYYYISSLKFFSSFSKVFINVYILVWIDQFGIKRYKTLLLTISFIVKPYGRVIGAWIGTVIFDDDWKKSFFYCGIIFLVLSFELFIIPQKYYSTKYMIVEQYKNDSDYDNEKLVETKSFESDIKKDYLDEEKNKSNQKEKIFEEKEIDINNKGKKEKLINEQHAKEENKNLKILSNFDKFKTVILNQCFIFSSLSRACIYFTFQIIHTFLKQYTFEALNYKDEITFFYYYSLTTILAPSLGSLIGGAICNKFLGGYESKNSIWIILFFGTSAVLFITLIRICKEFNYLIIYIFGYFFSVSAFLPTISGYVINSLHKELKGFGSSLDSLINNILGKLPSPIIYGILNDIYKKEKPKYAWNKCLIVYYLGAIFIYLTCFFKWKSSNKKRKKVKFKINNVVERTMKDYTLNRSSLVNAEKPIPKYDNETNNSSSVELQSIEESSSSLINIKNDSNQKLMLQINPNGKEAKNEKLDDK